MEISRDNHSFIEIGVIFLIIIIVLILVIAGVTIFMVTKKDNNSLNNTQVSKSNQIKQVMNFLTEITHLFMMFLVIQINFGILRIQFILL